MDTLIYTIIKQLSKFLIDCFIRVHELEMTVLLESMYLSISVQVVMHYNQFCSNPMEQHAKKTLYHIR